MMNLTLEGARRYLDYDPDTGVFIWRKREVKSKYDRIWNTQNAGNVAGYTVHHGYRTITIYGERFYEHRLAYFYMTGIMPPFIDHKDGDTTNNRFCNLRPATQTQNRQNTRRLDSNKSGYKGVSLHRPSGRWQAFISVKGRARWLGFFETPEDAANMYNRMAIKHFGEFARITLPPPPY